VESTQRALSKPNFSSSAVISSAVAHSMALVKNDMPEFDADILWRDFSINEVDHEVLVYSVYDTAHCFVSQYDFSTLAKLDDNASPDP
jgi:hypothetical protein